MIGISIAYHFPYSKGLSPLKEHHNRCMLLIALYLPVLFAVYLNVFVTNRFEGIKINTAAFKKVDNNTK